MRKLIQSDKLKIRILEALSSDKSFTYHALSKEISSSYDTLKENCYFLELLDFIKTSHVSKEESASKTPYTSLTITDKGQKFVKKIKEMGI